MTALAGALALLIGLTLALLGAGGSILTVPAIVFSLGVDPKTAIVMGLPIVGGAALVGAVSAWRRGQVDVKVAIPFGLAAMVGAYGGALLARGLAGPTQLVLLSVVMIVAAISMIRNASLPQPALTEPHRAGPLTILVGVVTGTLTGIVGIGGGFLLVPALVILARLPMPQAVGTSLTVIVLNTAAGYAGYHGVVDVPWALVVWFGSFTAIGIIVGGRFSTRVPQALLKRAFAVLLLVVAVSILYQNRSVF